ncbi:unnamed protein product [Clavelina lepadiformis]|uniref:Uncharacterized protein n=1 Tax=Clavelina lepadiformis TaxID=159417 RepID=A0ABP0FS66_CLALP
MSDADQLGLRYQSSVREAQGRFTAPHRGTTLFPIQGNFAFIPLERSQQAGSVPDNVALLPNSIIDYNFTPHQAIGDLGGTEHVVCIDLKAGCRNVSGPRTSFAVYLERFVGNPVHHAPPVVDYMDNAGLAIRTIIDM